VRYHLGKALAQTINLRTQHPTTYPAIHSAIPAATTAEGRRVLLVMLADPESCDVVVRLVDGDAAGKQVRALACAGACKTLQWPLIHGDR
jgi:hypothetical protein